MWYGERPLVDVLQSKDKINVWTSFHRFCKLALKKEEKRPKYIFSPSLPLSLSLSLSHVKISLPDKLNGGS
jgi:hypothetical protein